jgi:hypothetical protein
MADIRKLYALQMLLMHKWKQARFPTEESVWFEIRGGGLPDDTLKSAE